MVDALRIRGLRILLFPVVAPLILLGWVLYVVGERQACSKAVIKRKNHDYVLAEKSDENEDKVEMGLINTIVEDEVAY
ncbi:hypothetical protein JW988_09030 [Candidatus Bathyarchaeota archaeon]|nr:hypothetical protein [Candidatus Bathyarchaeota archaeon]